MIQPLRPEYRIRRRRKKRPGEAQSIPTGPYRWELHRRNPDAGLFRPEWTFICRYTTWEKALAAAHEDAQPDPHASAAARPERSITGARLTTHDFTGRPWPEKLPGEVPC